MSSIRILTDYHHTDLYQSFRYLFEHRLGGLVYRPWGEEWYNKGYFYHPEPKEAKGLLSSVNFNRDTARLPSYVPSHFPYTKDWRDWNFLDLAHLKSLFYDITHIVISNSHNIEPFRCLKADLLPDVKLWRYIGNEQEMLNEEDYDFILCADLHTYEKIKDKGKAIHYHPELAPEYNSLKSRIPYLQLCSIRNFLNFFYKEEGFSSHALWEQHTLWLNSMGASWYLHGLGTPFSGWDLPRGRKFWEWYQEQREHGNNLRIPDTLLRSDGEPKDHKEISTLLQNTSLMWHYKSQDGYGFMIHQAAALGVPVIVGREQYKGKTAGRLLDETTCVLLDEDSSDQDKLKEALSPEVNNRLSENLKMRFNVEISFEAEAAKIQSHL